MSANLVASERKLSAGAPALRPGFGTAGEWRKNIAATALEPKPSGIKLIPGWLPARPIENDGGGSGSLPVIAAGAPVSRCMSFTRPFTWHQPLRRRDGRKRT